MPKEVEKKEKNDIFYERLGDRHRGFEATKFTGNGRSNYVLKKSYFSKKTNSWHNEIIHVFPAEVNDLKSAVEDIIDDSLNFKNSD